ncbi:MAG TPA: hypothetical protein VGD10_06620 [Allosphingosinicella sp.]|uniref:hypothetical protein n=1 Tax=Allosphingosinicella sp. TaxID=2823234 RepID=UPI002EDA8BB0
MFKRTLVAAAAAASMAAVAIPASAQLTQQGGLVNVTVTDVSILNNFLNDTQIAALNNLNVPITVQVPVGIAANVCGVSAAVLGRAGSAAQCNATTGSRALAQSVNRQLLDQRR